MSVTNCLKECICWLLFILSTVTMLLMLSLALNDISLVSEQQVIYQETVNKNIPQLKCLEVCQTWYSQENTSNSSLCCDRYNMNTCLDKQKCKQDFMNNKQIGVQILNNDKFHQMTIAVVCILIMVMIAFRKGKRKLSETEEELDPKIFETIKNMVEGLKKQEKNAVDITQATQQLMNNNQQKNMELSNCEDNPSFISRMSTQANFCSQLNSYIRNHTCQQCIRGINK